MPFNVEALANPNILSLHPYVPGKPIEALMRETGLTDIIKLASNENPLGPSPLAIKAAQDSLTQTHLYPDPESFKLKSQLAKHLGCETGQLTIANGSDNILRLIASCFCNTGDEVLMPEYAFATFAIVSHAAGAKINTVANQTDWRADVDALLAAITPQTKLIFLANPNNPTGTYISHSEVERLLNGLPEHTLLVLDEAYCEFVEHVDYPDSIALQQRYPNLIITRTFSKIYGLASLRIGYAISHPEVSALLMRLRLPFDATSAAQAAATAALDDVDYVKQTLSLNQQGHESLEKAFKQLKLEYIPSVTNFLTVKFPNQADKIYQALEASGIIVRPLANYGLTDYLRISIGLPEENSRLINTLTNILEK